MANKSIESTYDLIFQQLLSGVRHSSDGKVDTYAIGNSVVVQRFGKDPDEWRESVKQSDQKYKGIINGKPMHRHIAPKWLFSLAEAHHSLSDKAK